MISELLFSIGYYLITALVGVVTAAIIYVRWHYGSLEKLKGLPVVIKPSFIGGSDFFVYKKLVHEDDAMNVKKYGKVFGYYEGRGPNIFVADPELIKLIFIKDFDHFQNKRILDFGHELINEMMDILPYEKWKVIRTFISPTLTTGKIRNMSIPMTEAIEGWVDSLKIKLKAGNPFIAKKMYTALTGDVIARCVFATKLNGLDDPNNIFLKHMQSIATDSFEMNYLLSFSHMFPFLSRLTPIIPHDTLEFYRNIIKNVMKSRRENNIKLNDFIDTLNDLMEKVENDPEYKRLKISETTVMCQALFLFLAGFETTAMTLSLLTYNLSKNSQAQRKLIEEVDSYLNRHNGKIEHETINELPYMAACIQETLRMFPPLIRVERDCTKDWVHQPSGLHIKKGMAVQVPIHYIHYNEEYYPEPEAFKPERFLPENKDKLNPYAFLSFGMGNHNCLGMRFAKEEMYLAMANVLKNFEFRENSETKLKFKKGRTFLMVVEDFSVDVIPRKK